MATTLERQRLRMDLGLDKDDIASLPDATIDDIFVEAGSYYTDANSITASTRIISIRRLLMQAANEVDYTMNRTSEKSSQRYTHLAAELLRWEGLLEEAESLAGDGSVRSGKPTRTPPRVREYPYGYRW